MHKLTLLFLSILLLFVVSCNENDIKKEQKDSSPKKSLLETKGETFDLTGVFNQRYKLSVYQKSIKLTNTKPIVILNLYPNFATPCVVQMKNLTSLQKEYYKDIFTISIPTQEISKKTMLKTVANNTLNHFFATSTKETQKLTTLLATQFFTTPIHRLPLTIIYRRGEYFTHYEGVIPLEMMQYDIKEAQKNLREKK